MRALLSGQAARALNAAFDTNLFARGLPIGAVLVNVGKTWFTGAFPELWLFVLGGLFILVTLVLPHGIVGFLRNLRPKRPLAEAAALEPRHT